MKTQNLISTLAFALALVLGACTQNTDTKTIERNSGGAAPSAPTTPASPQIQGVVNGGGGKGVLCKKDGQETLETLDLYEGRVLYDLKYTHAPTTDEEAQQLMVSLYSRYYWEPAHMTLKEFEDVVAKSFKDLKSKMRFVDQGKSLKATTDSNEAVVEDQCEAVQVAVYYDENIILVDSKLWKKMSPLNRAALLAHEALYKMARQSGQKDSVETRRLIANIFATPGISNPMADVNINDIYVEVTENSGRVISYLIDASTASSKAMLRVYSYHYSQFNNFVGGSRLARTTAMIKGISLSEFKAIDLSELTANPQSHSNAINTIIKQKVDTIKDSPRAETFGKFGFLKGADFCSGFPAGLKDIPTAKQYIDKLKELRKSQVNQEDQD